MNRFRSVVIIGFFIVLITITYSYAGDDAAMVIDIKDGEAFYETGENKGLKVNLMDFLSEGNKIKLAPNTTMILNYFASGIREELTGPGSITVGKSYSKKEGSVIVKDDKVDYIPPKSAINKADMQQAGNVVLRAGGLNRITITRLFDTSVRSLTPFFRWQPVSGAEQYKIRVFDIEDELLLEMNVDKTSIKYEESNLKHGEEYFWTVLAVSKGKVIAKGDGEFYILDEESLKKVIQDEKNIQKQYSAESTEAMISLAMVYQRYELFDDAAELFLKLHMQYPQNKNIADYLRILDPGFE